MDTAENPDKRLVQNVYVVEQRQDCCSTRFYVAAVCQDDWTAHKKVRDLLRDHPGTVEENDYRVTRWPLEYDPPKEGVPRDAAVAEQEGGAA
jgi:hypothetical protein